MSAPLFLDVPRFAAPALCAEADPDAFNPDKGGNVARAVRVCARCEARSECLAYAMQRRLVHPWDGVWGGTTPRQRRALLRQRRAA